MTLVLLCVYMCPQHVNYSVVRIRVELPLTLLILVLARQVSLQRGSLEDNARAGTVILCTIVSIHGL